MTESQRNIEKAARFEQLLFTIETLGTEAVLMAKCTEERRRVVNCMMRSIFNNLPQKSTHLKVVPVPPRGRGRPHKEKPYTPSLHLCATGRDLEC